jgi:hypothetical protein
MRKNDPASRERKARRLAEKMFFKLEREGDHYTLWRTAGIPEPVRRQHLSLDESKRSLTCGSFKGPVNKKEEQPLSTCQVGRRSFLCGVARKRGIETIVSNEPLPADHRICKTDSRGDGDRRDRIVADACFKAVPRAGDLLPGHIRMCFSIL